MKITHLGAKECVTGSCHLVQTRPDSKEGVNILVDCGIAQGHDPELPFDQFPVQPKNVDYLFLTHAHIDHIGRVPDLIDAGFKGEIICTHATKALLIPMLHDGMSFTHRSHKEIRRLELAIDDLSWGFELHEKFSLKKGITFKLGNAGHILGSCFIRFCFPQLPHTLPPNNSNKRSLTPTYSVIFSGDLGCTDTPILPDPDTPESCDLLILESTYGDRNHTSRKERIVDHLEQGLQDPKNDLFFVGYQAKGTPGRAMMEKKVPVKATIHTLSGYSAHADQTMLVNWVKSMPQPPGKITLVHGEPHAQKALAQRLGLK